MDHPCDSAIDSLMLLLYFCCFCCILLDCTLAPSHRGLHQVLLECYLFCLFMLVNGAVLLYITCLFNLSPCLTEASLQHCCFEFDLTIHIITPTCTIIYFDPNGWLILMVEFGWSICCVFQQFYDFTVLYSVSVY